MPNEIIVEMASACEIIVEISGMTYQSVSDQITALESGKADKTTVEAIGSEVTLARGTEPTLGARLDATDAQLAEIAETLGNMMIAEGGTW